ncbi:MAG: hypothetical protein JNL45_09575 [Hyphomicrobium sp.]|nr:hypothetical protein [Hyphomicrobium sp.]
MAGLALAQDARAEPSAASCPQASDISVLASPLAPWKGAPLRVVFAADQPVDGELSLVAPDGSVVSASRERRGGPPYFWLAETPSPVVGTWHAKLALKSATADCAPLTREIKVRGAHSGGPGNVAGSIWPVRDSWNRANENLYSAWIEKLFDAPLDTAPSWPALHEVLRDPARNVLFNHLGLREDEKGMVIRPDCADLPYFLRAYFAFKMGLPYGYSKCSRGGGGKPPRCSSWWNIQKEEPTASPEEEPEASGGLMAIFDGSLSKSKKQSKPPAGTQGLAAGFGTYLRSTVANSVHSGSGRTRADDENTDYYPVPLNQDTLRPGTVYADPYGHVLVIAKRVPQTSSGAGVILAVDGQPDGTVARKRFWRGNFLFAQDPAMGSAGFKNFRPVVRGKGGALRRLSNAEIAKSADYGNFSLDQAKLDVESFYDRMDDVMSPEPLDPVRALNEAIASLEEQVKARVTSVENGRKYHAGGGKDVGMPDGASIFETTGAWEDFATPSRDLRLLIAIDVVRGFPERVARRPERYAMPKDKSPADVKAQLEGVLASELAARKFTYTRTDGSEWTLALKDIVDRMGDLEMAYNINDCVERRWGAGETSDEASTCKRRAPDGQRKRMTEYRAWFHERRRPPRG